MQRPAVDLFDSDQIRAALIRERRLPRRQGQTISFDEHAVVFGLRLGKKADKHEGSAKHQAYQHHPTVRAFVVKIHDPHQNSGPEQLNARTDRLNLIQVVIAELVPRLGVWSDTRSRNPPLTICQRGVSKGSKKNPPA
jgi:hypothetical protein